MFFEWEPATRDSVSYFKFKNIFINGYVVKLKFFVSDRYYLQINLLPGIPGLGGPGGLSLTVQEPKC